MRWPRFGDGCVSERRDAVRSVGRVALAARLPRVGAGCAVNDGFCDVSLVLPVQALAPVRRLRLRR